MAADVADACDLLRGADFLVSFFFAVTKLKLFPALRPVRQERGNVSNEIKYATQIFTKFLEASDPAGGETGFCRSVFIMAIKFDQMACTKSQAS
jgi:hypothetical protein